MKVYSEPRPTSPIAMIACNFTVVSICLSYKTYLSSGIKICILFAAVEGMWFVKSEIRPHDVLIPVSSVRLLFGYKAA